jgi:hypothetical protein
MADLTEVLARYVPHGLADRAATELLAAGVVMPLDEHNAAVQREVDWANTVMRERDALKAEVAGLRWKVQRSRVDRVDATLRLLNGVDGGRAGVHGPGCHRRHAGCLADAVRRQLGSGDLSHIYLSTACLHAELDGRPELHDHCKGDQRYGGGKKTPARCKWRDCPCVCNCHDKETTT